MSEPITPKAEHHVVEGEFVDAEPENKQKSAQGASQKTAKKSAFQSRLASLKPGARGGLLFVIMLVSGTALAVALAAWLQLQKVQTGVETAFASIQQPAELGRIMEKIAYQQNQMQRLHQSQQTLQAQVDALVEQQASYQAQLGEMQYKLGQESGAQHRSNDSSDADTSAQTRHETPPVIHIQDPNLRQDMKQLEQELSQALAQVESDLARLNQQAQQGLTQISDYVESEAWQADKAQLQQQIQQLNAQLSELAKSQGEWIERLAPQLEQAIEDITPQLEGFWSRFNHLLRIQKQDEEAQ